VFFERWGFGSFANLGLGSIKSWGLESFEYFGLGSSQRWC
jgi:hypothetical protein